MKEGGLFDVMGDEYDYEMDYKTTVSDNTTAPLSSLFPFVVSLSPSVGADAIGRTLNVDDVSVGAGRTLRRRKAQQ